VQDYILEARKLIPEHICKKFILYFDKELEDAQTVGPEPGAKVDKKVRNCKTSYLGTLNLSFGQKTVLNYIKSKIFDVGKVYEQRFPRFNLSKLNQIDLLRYEANSYDAGYKWHIDASGKTAERIVSISICLNNDFQGGEFMFDLPEGEKQYPQNVGDLIMFPSNFMFPHQVNTVKKGTRYAIIAWGI
jgi:hypothetical protein